MPNKSHHRSAGWGSSGKSPATAISLARSRQMAIPARRDRDTNRRASQTSHTTAHSRNNGFRKIHAHISRSWFSPTGAYLQASLVLLIKCHAIMSGNQHKPRVQIGKKMGRCKGFLRARNGQIWDCNGGEASETFAMTRAKPVPKKVSDRPLTVWSAWK